MAIGRLNGATAFYLGKFAGKHVLATNYHVCPSSWACSSLPIRFPFLGRSFVAERLIFSYPEIDLSLHTLRVRGDEAEEILAGIAQNFALSDDVYAGQELLSIGFGVAGNRNRQAMVVKDSDCKVFSRRGEYRQLRDPDRVNPGRQITWSFANGCDGSHGDSGSAYVDRNTGALVGLIWTGAIPKSPVVQDSANLDQIFRDQSAEIWTELTYGAPAIKIRDVLRKKLAAGELTGMRREVVEAILVNP